MCYCFNGIKANKNPQKILSIETNCTRDLMHLKLNMLRPFKGMFYAKGFMDECNSKVGSNLLTLPLTSCGIRSHMLSKDTIEYSAQIVVQHSSKLQLKSDIKINVNCQLSTEAMDFNIDSSDIKSQRIGRMRFPKTGMKIRSWLQVDARKADYAIVGENITLAANAILPRNIGMRIVDCIAFDGVGDLSQRLFDHHGCAVDELIMPAFKESIKSIEDGWSKAQDDDIVQKTFSSGKKKKPDGIVWILSLLELLSNCHTSHKIFSTLGSNSCKLLVKTIDNALISSLSLLIERLN